MRNYYLCETAMVASSIQILEDGINKLNEIYVSRNPLKDKFICNSTLWEYDTSLGQIFELLYGIVSPELQRLIPYIFGSFANHEAVYANHNQMDSDFPDDCNAFIGIEFRGSVIPIERQVVCLPTYNSFVNSCLKYGLILNREEMRENLLDLFPNYVFEERAIKDVLDWKKSNLGLYNRLMELFEDIPLNPFTGGIGETEVLKKMNGVASKRINQANRVTYKLEGDRINILACSGHYD